MAAVRERHLTQPFQFEELNNPVTNEEESLPIEEGDSWIMLVYRFLTEDELPTDELSAK